MPGIPPGVITQRPNRGDEPTFGETIQFRHENGETYTAKEIERAYKDRTDNWTETDPLFDPLGSPERNRVTRRADPRRPCRTGRYGSLTCPSGEQAHHIVPDYTLRYGTRAEGVSGLKRIPGLPSFRDGPAICLQGLAKRAGDEHSIAHGADVQIAALGPKQASISAITAISVRSAGNSRPECRLQIASEVAKQPSLLGNTSARTTINPPGVWPPN